PVVGVDDELAVATFERAAAHPRGVLRPAAEPVLTGHPVAAVDGLGRPDRGEHARVDRPAGAAEHGTRGVVARVRARERRGRRVREHRPPRRAVGARELLVDRERGAEPGLRPAELAGHHQAEEPGGIERVDDLGGDLAGGLPRLRLGLDQGRELASRTEGIAHAYCFRSSGWRAATMRRMPSRHATSGLPAIPYIFVLSVVTLEIVWSVTSKVASRPVSSPRYAHHSSIEVCSPAQLTIVAGTLAASSIAGSWRTMSSSWIGLNRFGRSVWSW